MFKAFTVIWNDIPKDVNRDAFKGCYFEADAMKYYDDYLVVQVDGKTIYCKPVPRGNDGTEMITELMELAYYLGVSAGVKHEQGFMEGRTLRGLDEAKRLRPGGYQKGDIIKVDLSTGETEYFKVDTVL